MRFITFSVPERQLQHRLLLDATAGDPPDTELTGTPAELSNETTARFEFTTLPAGLDTLCAVDGAAVATCNDVLDRLGDSRVGALSLQFSDGQEVSLDLPSNETDRFASSNWSRA